MANSCVIEETLLHSICVDADYCLSMMLRYCELVFGIYVESLHLLAFLYRLTYLYHGATIFI